MEHDPTAVESNEAPPPGFQAQPDLLPDQTPELVEREPDLIAETEDAEPDLQLNVDGEADDGDDDVVEEGDDN